MNFNLWGSVLRKVNLSRQNVLVMKLCCIFMIIGCLQIHAAGTAQRVSLSFKQASLELVLKEIKSQTGLLYWCDQQLLKQAKPITVDLRNVDLVQALRACLKNQKLSFTIDDQVIVISAAAASSATGLPDFLPPIRIKVVDSDGQPLSGASVSVKNGSNSGVTDAEGVSSINVREGDVLVISYVGYETKEYKITAAVAVSSDRQLITLKQSDANLQEVVINKGYYTEAKRFSTGNVAQISSKEIEQHPVQNPLLALQGRVPGVEVIQGTGMNGGAVKVRIQGINSIGSLNGTTGTDPLIVVDGVPYPSSFISYQEFVVGGGSPLNFINPSDIESISVLKDADATAIYGSRAANGAIIITTKKSKAGKTKLIFDLQQGRGKVTRHVDMMNTRQYLDMRYEALKNDGIALATITPSASYNDLTLWDTTHNIDWQKELIGGTAQYTNINVGVSGGTDLVQYLIGGTYNRQTTVFPTDFADKAGALHFNLNGNSPNQRLHIQLSGSYQYNQNQLPDGDLTRNAILLEPVAPKLYKDDGSLNWAPNAGGSSTWINPLATTLYTEFSNTTKNLVSSMNIGYTILPGLALSSNFGYNNLQSDLFQGYKLEANRPEFRPFSQRRANFGKRNITTWIIEPQLQFERNIGKGKLNALVGTTVQKSALNYLYVQASGQPTNELLHALAAATSVSSGGSGNDFDYNTRFNGLFGRIGYNWDKKYLVNLTGRRDGSSKFGNENRFHNFWSAAAGWIFSEEKWFRSALPFLSFGKLRASYGTTGNDQINNYSYLSLYNIIRTDILYQGITSFNVAGLSNPFLQWEETRKLQGGIDLAAFNERIALGITYARNRSSNQLVAYVLPDLTGFSNFTKNFPATIQNTSWEFTLNTVNIKSKNLNWNTNFNLTIPRNKVVNFPGIELTSYASGNNGVIVGEPIGIQKLYQYGGVDPATGSYTVLDIDGKPNPQLVSGRSIQSEKVSLLPKYYGGVTNTISYKGFQLDFLFQFVYQKGANDLYYSNSVLVPGRFFRASSNQPVSVLKRWQKPGDASAIGRFTTDPNGNFSIWPNFYTDEGYSYSAGSYIRLKNLSLSWQLPGAWSKKARLQTARVYFRGQNLATITKYAGLDPETRSISTLPPLQMWTVGAKIEL